MGRVVFEVQNTWTSILEADEFILGILDKESRYPTPTAIAKEKGFQSPEGEGNGWDGWIRLLHRPRTMYPYFPSGLVSKLSRVCAKYQYTPFVKDLRVKPELGFPEICKIPLRDYQEAAVMSGMELGRGVFDMVPRCHSLYDRILFSNGEAKEALSVKVGSRLMGPDGKPRKVLEVHRGQADLFCIKPRWSDPFTVTGDTILVLEEHVRVGTCVRRHWVRKQTEVTVMDWLKWPLGRKRKSYLIYTGIPFSKKKLPIPPYLLGVLLGDGSIQHTIAIASGVSEIQDAARELAAYFDLRVRVQLDKAGVRVPSYYLTQDDASCSKPNRCMAALRELGLGGKHARQKFLPKVYLRSTRGDRLDLLAGLLDTDGYLANGCFYEFSTASRQMASDVLYLARSLGFSALAKPKVVKDWTYWRVNILGDISKIPLRRRKKQTKRRPLWRKQGRSSFTVTPVGCGEYVGWSLGGDHRYLTEGFVVNHNSGKTRCLCELQRRIALPTIWIAPTDRIVDQTAKVIEGFFGKNYGHHLVGSSNWKQATNYHIVVCTMATATMLPQEFYDSRQMIVVDEWHHVSARSYTHNIFPKCDHIYYRFGMSGTVFRSGTDAMAMHGILSNVIYKVGSDELLKRGYLVPTKVAFIPVPAHPKLRGAGSQFNGGFGKYGIHEHAHRNQLAANAALLLHQMGRKVMSLVGTKAQGRELNHRIHNFLPQPPAGAEFDSVEFLSTDRPRDVQVRVIESFLADQEVKILLGTSLLGEGVDLPYVDALVYARGEKAEVSLVQNAYRVGTAVSGKREAIIIDFADRHHRMLLGHSAERLETYYREPTFEVTVLEDANQLPIWLEKIVAKPELRS